MYPDHEPQPQGSLPIISDETGQRLIEELGLDVDSKTQEVVAGITGEQKQSPSEMRRELALNVFSRIADVNREAVKALQKTIEANIWISHEDRRSACAEGMAIVIDAFDIESDFRLVNDFANLQQEDLERIDSVVAESLGGGESRDLLQEVLGAPKIPDQQIILNDVVNKAAQADRHYGRTARLGAAIMYKVLSEMKPKLLPPTNPNPPSVPPPQEI